MKVKFLKNHNRHRADEIADVVAAAANYYIRCNVAVAVAEDEQPAPVEKPAPKKPAKKK